MCIFPVLKNVDERRIVLLIFVCYFLEFSLIFLHERKHLFYLCNLSFRFISVFTAELVKTGLKELNHIFFTARFILKKMNHPKDNCFDSFITLFITNYGARLDYFPYLAFELVPLCCLALLLLIISFLFIIFKKGITCLYQLFFRFLLLLFSLSIQDILIFRPQQIISAQNNLVQLAYPFLLSLSLFLQSQYLSLFNQRNFHLQQLANLLMISIHILDHLIYDLDLPIQILRFSMLYFYIKFAKIMYLVIFFWFKIDLKQLYLMNQVLSFLFITHYLDFCLLHFQLKLSHSHFYPCLLFFCLMFMSNQLGNLILQRHCVDLVELLASGQFLNLFNIKLFQFLKLSSLLFFFYDQILRFFLNIFQLTQFTFVMNIFYLNLFQWSFRSFHNQKRILLCIWITRATKILRNSQRFLKASLQILLCLRLIAFFHKVNFAEKCCAVRDGLHRVIGTVYKAFRQLWDALIDALVEQSALVFHILQLDLS